VFALLAIVGPSAVDAIAAAHVVLDHHDHDAAPHPAPLAGWHGHHHEAGTPAHEHGTTSPASAVGALHVLAVATTAAVGTLDVPAADFTPGADLAAPAPSPPRVTTTILRI
jgi:hypothetical protein